MADYFLRALDSSRAYRITYQPPEGALGYRIEAVHAVGIAGATTPDGRDLAALDMEVGADQVLVDMVLGALTPCGLAEYKEIAKAAVDTRW